ncbi:MULTISPECIES: DUF1266 domain-containing protein [unclassified Streptomyces]|uniref:DUF1266 domain-containing protein n=1 Tax=unclassified Streptomyces TaxID=2593676 RepID=UPI0006AE9BB1|nr:MULTISPECIES: DUF1266 domain-containing protein [unclassified Streptomyces]KOX17494.1 hypothetical protein ADL06_32190 [Streptomyces sp. NRRL F-6491]KOX36394.1 hypothetical protein ADL08_32485 [Streptomyces sp. NRRL F-6492]
MSTGGAFSGWVPPTEVEHRLYEAAVRNDTDAATQVLASTDLFILAPKVEVDADPGRVHWRSYPEPGHRTVITRGMLPPWHPDWVFHCVSLRWIATFHWNDAAPRPLVVNPGSPVQFLLPSAAHDRATWLQYHARHRRSPKHRLVALRHGPLRGPLAFGLACGGHLAVSNGVPWNEAGTLYMGYTVELDTLRDAWGVTEPSGWRGELDALLAGRNSPPEPDFVLSVRERLTAEIHGVPSADLWRDTAAGHAQDLGASPESVREVGELVRRIVRYEARFRADGLLPPEGRVRKTVAYDYGRAVNVARWGLSARFCTPHEAEQAIVHAGALSRAAYTSWEDFSAGYALGRVLRFDEEEYGSWYEDNVTGHRVLTEHEGSPWKHIPWH